MIEDKKDLLEIARKSISLKFEGDKLPVNEKLQNKYAKKQGVFVTLKKNNSLRGCIGFIEPLFSLYDAIVQAARCAAFEDPRFDSLTKEELNKIKIEISILTEPKEIKTKTRSEYLDFIKIGKHGLIIKNPEGKSGLLLPQVPLEQNWDEKEYLGNLCYKAGLNKDAWVDSKNKIYTFECDIFNEE